MLMKLTRWLYGLTVACLGLLDFPVPVQAADPPWPPTVMVLALDPCAAEESSDTATFLVVRTGLAHTDLTVQYTLGGTALNGVDYETLPGAVTIPPFAWLAPVTVTPHDDFLVEGAESVVIALQQPPEWPPPFIVTWPSVAFAEIADNDLAPTNQPPQVSLVRPPDGAIFDAYDDISMVARAFDRDGRVITVEFFAGNLSLGIVTNRPVLTAPEALLVGGEDPAFDLEADLFPDLDVAADLTPIPIRGQLFRLVWPDAPPGTHVLTAVATDNDGASTRSAPVTIKVLEPPPQPVVTIRATDPVAAEPDPATDYLDTATFKVHRTGPTNLPLQVQYRIGGTALNGTDYKSLPRSLMIPAGERCIEVVIEPLDDLLVEGLETVVLTIVPPLCIAETVPPPPDCYRVGLAHSAKAIIRDNDTPPNRPPLVRLVKPEDGDVFLAPVDIRLAAVARDFDGFVTTVEFLEGTNSLGIITNNPLASSVVRPPFALTWSNVPPGHYVLTAVATDNDGASTQSRPVEIKVVPHVVPPEVNIFTLDAEAAETPDTSTPNTAVFSVTRTGSTLWPLLVFYSIGGTASNGVDYRPLTGRVLIPAGAVSNNIVVEPIDDNLVEGTEGVLLKLEPAPILTPANTAPQGWYRIGSNYVARAIIRDNDVAPTNLPPRVAIMQPEDGEVFVAPVDLRLVAAAHDSDGWVRTVEFFDGPNSLGIVSNNVSSSATPEQLFWWLWQHVPVGNHLLTAKATDNRGASAVSEPVAIRVLPPPRSPIVTIYATDPYASEGNRITPWAVNLGGPVTTNLNPKTATFTVFRRGDTNEDLTVFYRLGGTALNGADYRRLAGEVTILRGALSARIVVDPIDDILPEPTETVVANLVPVACPAVYPPPPGCYIVGDPAQAVAYIFDNDFNQSPKLEIVQPQDGAVFRAGTEIEIDVLACDPDGWVGKVQFCANNVQIGEQEIFFFVPPPPGQPQRFSMVWSNVPPGSYVLTAKATDNLGAGSVSDPVRIKVVTLPPVPIVTIRATDPVATEPNPLLPVLPDTATFTVSRTGSQSTALTVAYRIGGTAANSADYEKLSGYVTIPAGAPSAEIEVVPLHDVLVEGTESVILALAQLPCATSNVLTADCYLVGQPGRAIAYIRDNDAPPNRPPTVAIVSPPNGALFSAPVDVRLVAAAADPDGWVTTVEFFDGTNSLGIASNNPWVLEAAPIRLPDLGLEVVPEHSVTRPFSLVWSNVPPGRHSLTAVATDNAGDSTRSRPIEITVLDPSNLPVVNIMALDALAREGTTNTATFRVRRVGATNEPLTVFYAIRGTAQNGVDYVQIPTSITIPEGRRSVRIRIEPLDDNLPERFETVLLRLIPPPVGPATYHIGRPASAGAVILDNDWPILRNQDLPDGSVHVRLALPSGMPFRLEASADLANWEPVVCDTAAEAGLSFVEDDLQSHPQRFFRIVQEFGDLEED